MFNETRASSGLVIGFFLAVLTLTGCGDDDTGDSTPAVSLDGTTWSVTAATMDDVTLEPVEGYPASLSIDGDRLRGSTGCNSFDGTVSIAPDGAVTIGGLAVTEIGCDRPVMDFEASLLRALTASDRVAVDGDRLTFTNADGSAVIDLVARP